MSDQPISTNKEPKATEGKVGYKHPPVTSQFRKGQSGNPRGRRKGQRNLAPVLREVLRQTVKVKRGGKTERMSKGEALIQMLLSKAHSGDARAIEAVLVLTEKNRADRYTRTEIGRTRELSIYGCSRNGTVC